MGDGTTSSRDMQLRWPSLRSCTVALLAFAIAAAFANSFRFTTSSLTDVSLTWIIIVTGAIPWVLQLLTVLALFKSSRRHLHRGDIPLKFAAIVITAIGASWWIGILLPHHGQTPMEAMMESALTSIERHFSGPGLPFVLIHRICGPLTAIGRLHGLYTLAGTNYFQSLASICALTGYLTFTAHVCQVGSPGPTSVRDVLRFTLMMCVIFIPPVIRFGIAAFAQEARLF